MIVIRGERAGAAVVEFELAHGEDPAAGLAARGWSGRSTGVEGVLGRLVLRFEVVAVTPLRVRHGPHGPGLGHEDRAEVRPHQRVAAYAVVVADARLLLTQLAPRTGAAGRWNLPGGGIEPEEGAAEAVVREVLEETGQVVDDVQFVDVMTQHWVGRSERGAEDYHAVRLIHTARCTRPTRPVVHDVGGSTSDARWVPLEDLGGVPVVASIPAALRAAGVPVPGAWPQS